MISGGPKDTITSLWTKGLKALVPPNSFGPPTMVGVVVDFKDRAIFSTIFTLLQDGSILASPLILWHGDLKDAP